jgi:hypothetical protein
MSEILRVINTTGAGDTRSDRLNNWPKGLAADGIWLDCTAPVVLAAPGSPTTADLINVINYFLSLVNVKYRLGAEFQPYMGITGNQLRNVHRLMTMREVFNDFVGVAKLAVAQNFNFRVYMTPNRQKSPSKRRTIGWTQGQTFEVEVTEGAVALVPGALGITRGVGNFTVRVVPNYKAGPNHFSHLPHYRQVNRAALDVGGPDGTMLAVWDDNAPFATTVIGKHSVRIGDRELVRQVEPRYGDEEYAKNLDAGGADITDEVTLFYAADPFADERELPAGAAFVKMVNQDVASLLCRFVYFPTVGENEAREVAIAAADAEGTEVSAQLPEPSPSPEFNGSQATAPLELVTRADARFENKPGIIASKLAATTYVPASAVSTAGGVKGLAGANGVRSFQKRLGLLVPGATLTSGKGKGGVRDAIRGAFSRFF